MCLLTLAFRVHPQFDLAVAGNRDERHSRPSAALDWWNDAPEVLGGRDLEAGGSWLGVQRDGRFAARGLAAAPIMQAQDAVALIPGAPAAQAARMDAENVGALQPRQGPGQHATDDLLDFHSPLHSDRGIEHVGEAGIDAEGGLARAFGRGVEAGHRLAGEGKALRRLYGRLLVEPDRRRRLWRR